MNLKKLLIIGLLVLLPLQVFGAEKYWVGGTGNWSDATNHWANSSGGAPNTGLPAAADNVNFDALSHNASYTVTMDAADVATNWTWGNPSSGSPTFTLDAIPSVKGSLVLVSGMTIDGASNFKINAVTGGHTVTTNGVSFGTGGVTFQGASGGWTLQDALTSAGILAVNNGVLDTNGQTINCTALNSNNTNTRGLTLGASVINAANINMGTSTNLTLTANTSTINLTGYLDVGSVAGGGLTFATVNFNGGDARTWKGSNIFGTVGSDTTAKILIVRAGTTQTITTWGVNGDESQNITLVSETPATSYEIAVGAGTVDCAFCDITDMEATGGAKFLGGENGGGNTGFYRFESDARMVGF